MELKDLIPNPKNPRKIKDDALVRLKSSIEKFGDLSGIVYNRRTHNLVGGHQRLKVLPKDAKIFITEEFDKPTRCGTLAIGKIIVDNEVFTYREVDFSEEDEIAANLAANKHGGTFDYKILPEVLLELEHKNYDLDLTGFSPKEVEDIMTYLGGTVLDKSSPNKKMEEESSPPLISYYGGKVRLSSKIIPLIPKHTVYVEPFCGSAAVFFKKPKPKVGDSYYREVLNDLDKDVVNLYRVFQTRYDEILHLLKHTPHAREEFNKARDILKNRIEADDLWRAWATYVFYTMSFNGGDGWGISVFGANDAAINKNRLNKLDSIRDRLLGVYIECTDALDCILRWDSPQTFFYCDPPYAGTHQRAYNHKYSPEDFQKLVDTLENIEGSFILSTYKNDAKIPKEWEKYLIKTSCSSNVKGKCGKDRDKSRRPTDEELADNKRIEILYRRKNKVEPRFEIRKLYESGAFDCFTG